MPAINTASPSEQVVPSASPGATGLFTRTLFTNGSGWIKLLSMALVYVTGITAASTGITLVVADSKGNTLLSIILSASQAISTTVVYNLGGAMQPTTAQLNNSPIPTDFFVPPGGTIAVSATAGSTTDTTAANLVFSN
jgi:hypothetical protein